MTPQTGIPDLVITLWHVTVLAAAVVFVPLSVYMLHMLYRAARSTRHYARDGLAAARAIDGNLAGLIQAVSRQGRS